MVNPCIVYLTLSWVSQNANILQMHACTETSAYGLSRSKVAKSSKCSREMEIDKTLNFTIFIAILILSISKLN